MKYKVLDIWILDEGYEPWLLWRWQSCEWRELIIVGPGYRAQDEYGLLWRLKKKKLTLLEELEAIYEACLIAGKQEAPTVMGLCRMCLLTGDFWAKLNTSAHDAIAFNRNGGSRGRWYLKVISGVGLSNMGGERATQLGVDLSGKRKVVVSVEIFFSFL